jgi:hypothetical protein
MPRRKDPGAVASIQQQLTEAANVFAREILRILRATTLSDLTVLAGKAGPAAPTAAAAASREVQDEGAPRRKRPSQRTSALRRIAGTKPVVCPVPGCENNGVRSKMNFCNDHASSLSKAERLKLRQQQKARHISESIALPEAGKPQKGGKGGRKKKAS